MPSKDGQVDRASWAAWTRQQWTVIAGVKIDGNSFMACRKGEQGRLLKMSFYTPEITNIPAGKPVMDHMVRQNHLLGRYMIHSFQEVKSVDRTGANQKGWYYHVRITEDMRDKILQRNCSVCVLLQRISLSVVGKRTTQTDAEPSRAKHQKEAQKSKKREHSKRT